jgi:hypothetical protein
MVIVVKKENNKDLHYSCLIDDVGTSFWHIRPSKALLAWNFNWNRSWWHMQVWVFALSLLGLIPLAERVSFLTE